MRNVSLARRARGIVGPGAAALAAASLAASAALATAARAQAAAPASHAGHESPAGAAARLSPDDIVALAKLTVALAEARDSAQKQLASPRNKTPQAQQALRDALAARIAALTRAAGVSDAELRRRTFLVSTDSASRVAYDATIARLTGAPLPGQGAGAATVLPVPPGPAGVHAAHVANAFSDTPGGRGLLPTALAEARTAAQHAGLALRAPEDLASIKQHARHVAQSVDPAAAGAAGAPGLGYGVKRAALAVAEHVELAAKAEGAPAPLVRHAPHVALAARQAARRADEIVALARRIDAATSAADAAALASQLVSLANELVAGRDADANGRVDPNEGGLQLCEEHLKLMLAP